MNQELTIQTNNLPESSITSLGVIQNEREALINAYDDVITLEINDENIKVFKELRLKIRDNRTKGIEPWHTTNKAVSLAIGRTIDAIKNREVEVNKRMEEKLLGAEKHFENLEKERVEKLNKERIELVRPYLDEVEHLVLHDMEEDIFNAYLETKKRNFKAIQEAEAKSEKERLEKDRLDKLEIGRINIIAPLHEFKEGVIDLRNCSHLEFNTYFDLATENKSTHEEKQKAIQEENDRLRKEAEEKKNIQNERSEQLLPYMFYIGDLGGVLSMNDSDYLKEFKIIKKRAEEGFELARRKAESDKNKEDKQAAILKKERETKELLQAELKAKNDAELKETKRLEELAKAPIKEQLTAWVDLFELPQLTTSHNKANEIIQKHKAFKKWAKSKIDKL